jgi:hypothetical protein
MSFFLDMLIILSTAHKVLFAKVALQTNSKEGRNTVSSREDSRLALRHVGSLTAAWLGPHKYDKYRRPEAHGQESEPRR